jgi:hypothetical protein
MQAIKNSYSYLLYMFVILKNIFGGGCGIAGLLPSSDPSPNSGFRGFGVLGPNLL